MAYCNPLYAVVSISFIHPTRSGVFVSLNTIECSKILVAWLKVPESAGCRLLCEGTILLLNPETS